MEFLSNYKGDYYRKIIRRDIEVIQYEQDIHGLKSRCRLLHD